MNWTLYAGSVLATIVLWWGSTGVIAWLVGRSVRTYPNLLRGTSVLALLSLAALALAREADSSAHAVAAFLAALGLWSWVEITFLTGRLTGPRKTASTATPNGWRHARDAIAAILWHEFAIIAVVALAALVTAGSENPVGLLTLLLLWIMRSSAKLNLFLGVRNLGEVFLPPHLGHLLGYLRRRPMNALFPFSVILGVLLIVLGVDRILDATTSFDVVAYSLLTTLAALALLEHVLMVLPLPAEALWRWSLTPRRSGDSA